MGKANNEQSVSVNPGPWTKTATWAKDPSSTKPDFEKGWQQCIHYYRMKFCPFGIYCVKKHDDTPNCYCTSVNCKRLHPFGSGLNPWNIIPTPTYVKNQIRQAKN